MKTGWITYFTEPRKGIQINFFASQNNMDIRTGELKIKYPVNLNDLSYIVFQCILRRKSLVSIYVFS